jgi:15-cis-phytoene synthase/lycopene beta-cyclase
VSTIPWDSYLIRTGVWSYSSNVIVGPTLHDIPLEELFFFIIQTFNTSLLYLFCSKATFHPIYLRPERTKSDKKGPLNEEWRNYKFGGQFFLVAGIAWAVSLIHTGGEGTYMGLIIAWAFPFLLLLWSLSYQLLIGLPWTNTLLPIAVPTLYLWIVDTLALQRGTWVIESGTKLGIHVWPALEIEEATFFLVTNTLIVFGLVAFDNALAVLNALTPPTERTPNWPSPWLLIKALLKPASEYDEERINGLKDSVQRLERKSRSFFLASGTFEGKLRIALINLYSFCRVADDLVDDAKSIEESRQWVSKLERFIDMCYQEQISQKTRGEFVRQEFPVSAQSALLLLPYQFLSKGPLDDLLKGFEMDLDFSNVTKQADYPIKNTRDLDLYAARVAGTVAKLVLELIFAYSPNKMSDVDRHKVVESGNDMGKALQFVNISRDIGVDAQLRRCYIPTEWLTDESLTPEDVIRDPNGIKINVLRQKLLDRAFAAYQRSRAAIELVPQQAGPLRVCVESYMEIGRVLRNGDFVMKRGRATVPKLRRLVVAWKALSAPDCSS